MPSDRLRHKVELYGDWFGAAVRLRQLRLMGYRAYAVDSEQGIAVYINPGKHLDLSRLPAPSFNLPASPP